MKVLKLIKHILKSVWKNATPIEAALITAVFLAILIIIIVSVVQVLIPFTYIAI